MGLDLNHFLPKYGISEKADLEYFSADELKEAGDYLKRHQSYLVQRESEDGNKMEVIYFEQIGYQRKGMNNKFSIDFINCKLYLDLASVKRAYEYLEGDHINSLEHLQKTFKENFIDKFVDGESVFFISW